MITAIAAALSGDIPKHVFDAVSDSDDEATAMYQRYTAARRMHRNAHDREPPGDA